MKDKRPPKSRPRRLSERDGRIDERPARARAPHKAQSQNDRRKSRRSGGTDASSAAVEKPKHYPAQAATREKQAPGRKTKAGLPPNPAPNVRTDLNHKKAPARVATAHSAKKQSSANLNGGLWLYGRHAVAAALGNPQRKIRRLLASRNAADWLRKSGVSGAALAMLEDAAPEMLDELLQDGAVHQGLAALAEPLARKTIDDACSPATPGRPVLILDQITDPQNIGALFRSAAAFGARAVIVQDRRTPPLSGALAKAAAGAVEKIPCVEVVNIARAIETLQEMGYFCAGLAGEADADISALPAAPLALVLGAEGDGLRRLVAEKCDQLFRIPIHSSMESLNVSTAAAISLYEAQRPR